MVVCSPILFVVAWNFWKNICRLHSLKLRALNFENVDKFFFEDLLLLTKIQFLSSWEFSRSFCDCTPVLRKHEKNLNSSEYLATKLVRKDWGNFMRSNLCVFSLAFGNTFSQVNVV